MEEDEQAPKLVRWWPALILLSTLPLIGGVALLQLMTPNGRPLSSEEVEVFVSKSSPHDYLPGGLTYAGLTLIHIAACLAALYIAWTMLRWTPRRRQTAAVGALMAGSLMLALPFLAGLQIKAYDLSYFAIADLYGTTGAGRSFLGAPSGWPRPLDLAIYLPTALGIAAVAMTAAAATGQLRLLHQWTGDSEMDEEGRLCVVLARIKRCLYTLAAVLVTSTLGASFFFHMPAKMQLANKAAESAILLRRLEGFAAELSIFWGAVFTLTLAAAVGLPMLLAQKRLADFMDQLKPPQRARETRERLAAAGLTGKATEQFKFFLALAAPLASGPVSAFLQAANG